jgi:hypothetical protein
MNEVLYEFIAGRAGFRCEYCHAPAALFNFPLEVEHVIPSSRARDDSPENLALACRACNVFKGSATRGQAPGTGAEVELFHPRRHRWEDHFQFNPESAELIPVTPIGRATAARLRLNHISQLRARREWMRLGQFP